RETPRRRREARVWSVNAESAAGADRLVYGRAPLAIALDLAADDVVEERAQSLGHVSDRAVADRSPVDLDDRRDLGRGAGHEDFVGRVELASIDLSLDRRDAELALG